jgi:hypothetical protein
MEGVGRHMENQKEAVGAARKSGVEIHRGGETRAEF